MLIKKRIKIKKDVELNFINTFIYILINLINRKGTKKYKYINMRIFK